MRWSSANEPVAGWPLAMTRWLAIVFCVVLSVVGFVPINYPDDFQRFVKALSIPFGVLGAGFGVALALSWWAMKKRPIASVFAVYVSTLVFVLMAASAAFPAFLLGRSNRELCLRIKDKIADCKRVVSYGADREGSVFYLDRQILESRRRKPDETLEKVVREELAAPGGAAVVMQRRYYARMIGIKGDQLSFDVAELKRTAPEYAEFVDGNNYLVVLKSKLPVP